MNELKQIRTMAELILEKVSALEGVRPQVKVEPKFAVGDRVHCPSDGDGIGTVIEVYIDRTHGDAYSVQFPSDFGAYTREYYQSYLKLVEEKPKFKVGDRVQFVNKKNQLVQAPISLMAINDLGCHTKDEWNYWFDKSEHNTDTNFIPAGAMPEHELTKVDRVWHSGAPPHVGWWNANKSKNTNLWRWWDGEAWSHFVHRDADADMAAVMAMRKTIETGICWSDYYPENARVPRVNPGV